MNAAHHQSFDPQLKSYNLHRHSIWTWFDNQELNIICTSPCNLCKGMKS
jgi:hypothetical protein